jgi:L-threonylcarbamoyladenylate synthase
METQIVTIETPELFDSAVETASGLLRKGQLVAVPTETVYGLAGNVFHGKAIKRIFEVKGRPARNPLIVHIVSIEMARECALTWPATAEILARKFWPGPLTIVLEKRPSIPATVTAGGETVALRWPAHPFMQAVIKKCRVPLAAPSANLSSRISPTTADHVRRDLWGKIPLIVDAGPAAVGIESTVVDLTVRPFRILRPGMITDDQIKAALGVGKESEAAQEDSILKSPGLLEKHYAPRARLLILKWSDDADLADQLSRSHVNANNTHVIAHENIPLPSGFAKVCLIPHDPEAYARALYAELHRADDEGADTIIVEAVPGSSEWAGIRDRLKRAAAK